MKKFITILIITIFMLNIISLPVQANSQVPNVPLISQHSFTLWDIVSSFSELFNTLRDRATNTTGGISVTLNAKTKSNKMPSKSNLLLTKNLLEKRLQSKGFDDVNISIDDKTGKIDINAYSGKFNKIGDSRNILNEVIKPGLITFQEVSEDKKDSSGIYLPTGKIIIDSSNIQYASAEMNTQNDTIELALTLDKKGKKKFALATKRLIGKPIGIFYDNNLLTAPNVSSEITSDTVVISGVPDDGGVSITFEEMAKIINLGALPVSLSIENFLIIES